MLMSSMSYGKELWFSSVFQRIKKISGAQIQQRTTEHSSNPSSASCRTADHRSISSREPCGRLCFFLLNGIANLTTSSPVNEIAPLPCENTVAGLVPAVPCEPQRKRTMLLIISALYLQCDAHETTELSGRFIFSAVLFLGEQRL